RRPQGGLPRLARWPPRRFRSWRAAWCTCRCGGSCATRGRSRAEVHSYAQPCAKIPAMTEAPGGSAGFGHGSDPDEHEALLRRIREFLRHGAAAEAGVEEWGAFAAQLRFLREGLPPDERAALLERWARALLRALPDLQLATDQRENVLLALEAAAAEGAAWAALEDRAPPEQPSGVAPVLRPSVWTLDWESATGTEEDGDHREDEALVLTAADARTEARFVLADRLVLAHLAADVRGLLAEGQPTPAFPEADQPTGLPS